MKFSKNLQELRTSRGLSQEQLADKIGVSRQAIGSWESGKTLPEIDKVVEICKIFGVSANELLDETSKRSATKFEKAEYENTYNKVAFLRATGMLILFLGIGLAAFFSDSMPNLQTLSGISLMIAMAISIPLLIFAKNIDDLANEKLIKSEKSLEEIFSETEIQTTQNVKNISAITLVSLTFVAIGSHQIITHFTNFGTNIANMLFMILLGLGISIATYGNSIFSKIDNFRENAERDEEKDSKIGLFAVIGALVATAIYLICGFGLQAWDSAKLIYPIYGISVAVFAIFVKKIKK